MHSLRLEGAGTLPWMAPEVYDDGSGREYGAAADVYSFGIVLWEILTRRFPYEGCVNFPSSIRNQMDFVTNGGRPTIPDDCPTDYKRLMEVCWSGVVDSRPTFYNIVGELDRMCAIQDALEVETREGRGSAKLKWSDSLVQYLSLKGVKKGEPKSSRALGRGKLSQEMTGYGSPALNERLL